MMKKTLLSVLKKILSIIGFFLVVSFICFVLIKIAPGDPVRNMLGGEAAGITEDQLEQMREELGLNDPIVVQYVLWLQRAVHLDFGTSYMTNAEVTEELAESIVPTLVLSAASLVVMAAVSLPLGILSAKKKDSIADKVINGFCMIFTAIPTFWLGLLCILLFSVKLHWFPTMGSMTVKGLVLPSVTLGVNMAPQYIKLLRENLIDSMKKDFVTSARARGIPERQIFWKHIFRDSMIPVLTVFGVSLGSLLGGAVITETIFGFPGIGKLAIDALNNSDYTVLQGFLMLLGVMVFVINNVMEILYRKINPAIALKEVDKR
jgi:peptide/nickel transport system permease protein